MKDYHARIICLAIMCSGIMMSGHFNLGIMIYGVFSLVETMFMRDL